LPADLFPSDLLINVKSDGVAPLDGGDLQKQCAAVRVGTGMQ